MKFDEKEKRKNERRDIDMISNNANKKEKTK